MLRNVFSILAMSLLIASSAVADSPKRGSCYVVHSANKSKLTELAAKKADKLSEDDVKPFSQFELFIELETSLRDFKEPVLRAYDLSREKQYMSALSYPEIKATVAYLSESQPIVLGSGVARVARVGKAWESPEVSSEKTKLLNLFMACRSKVNARSKSNNPFSPMYVFYDVSRAELKKLFDEYGRTYNPLTRKVERLPGSKKVEEDSIEAPTPAFSADEDPGVVWSGRFE